MVFDRILIIALCAGLAGISAAAGRSWKDKVETTPSIVQHEFPPYGANFGFGGEVDSSSGAVAMLLVWLYRNGFDQVVSGTTQADRQNLVRVLSGLFATQSGNVSDSARMASLVRQVRLYLVLRGIAPGHVNFERRVAPNPAWLAARNREQSVVLLMTTWYGGNEEDPAPFTRAGHQFLALLGVDQANSSLTVNNPIPRSLFDTSKQTVENPQTVGLSRFTHDVRPPLDESVFSELSTPLVGPGTLLHPVMTEALVVTLSTELLSQRRQQPSRFILSGKQIINTADGSFEVLAPLDGSGILQKYGSGTLIFTEANRSNGRMEVYEGGVEARSSETTPFGTGSVFLKGDSRLTLSPSGRSGQVRATLGGFAKSLLQVGGGNVISLNRGGHRSLTLSMGAPGSRDGFLRRQARGTLVLDFNDSLRNVGSKTRILLGGTNQSDGPRVIAPWILGQDSGRRGFLLQSGSSGLVAAPLRELSPGVNRTDNGRINRELIVPGGRSIAVNSLVVDGLARLRSGGRGSKIQLGSAPDSDAAALIMNGGVVSTEAVDFGRSEALVFAGLAGGAINSRISTRNFAVIFGDGEIQLKGSINASRGTIINSGTLSVSNRKGYATGRKKTVVRSGATLGVHGRRTKVGDVELRTNGSLILDDGSVRSISTAPGPGRGLLQSGGILAGSGRIERSAKIRGTIRAGRVQPGILTFEGPVQMISPGGSTVFEWSLRQLTSNSNQMGTAWNALIFERSARIGSSGSPVVLRLDFQGIPGPNSSDPFWAREHTWPIFVFRKGSVPPLFIDDGNVMFNRGTFDVFSGGNVVWLRYRPF